MLRPTIFHSASRRAIGRNLALDLVVAVGMGVTMALVGAILPTVARRDGLNPIGLSALAAAPYVANLLGAFAGRFGPRNQAHLSLVRGLGSASLLILFLVPSATVVVAVSIAFWLSLSFGNPFHFRLWGAMYPSRIRGRVVGVVGMGRAAAAALAAFGGGVLADRIGGDRAVAVAGLIGVVCAVAYAGFRATTTAGAPTFSARESVRALLVRPVLARIVLAQGFYGGGLIAATPLFALVHVDRLHLSLADVGIIGILAAVATTVAFPIWGLVADRVGSTTALWMGSAIGLFGLVSYAIAPSVTFLWLGALATGVGGAAIDLGIAAAVSDETPLATRAAAMSGWNAVTGARGIAAAFLMSVLIQARLLDVTAALWLCVATSAIGVGLFAQANRARREAGEPAVERSPVPSSEAPVPA